MDMDDFFGRNFGGDHFGSQHSFFGGGHFQHAEHIRRHQQAHQQAHRQTHQHHNFNQQHQFHQQHSGGEQFGAQAHSFTHSNTGGGGAGKTCRTVTQRVGNMVTSYTTCS